VSAVLYYNIGAYILTLGVEMYLWRASIDVAFGLMIILSPAFIKWAGWQKFAGNGGTLIQPLILAFFTVYHLAAYFAINVGFFSFFSLFSLFGGPEISLYVWITNALNLTQIIVAVGVIGDMVVRFSIGIMDAIKYSGRASGVGNAFVEGTKGRQER
jgi:hypothetical protein